jgi:peroxisomal 3,2-trans-enoyl-CoA isomerase
MSTKQQQQPILLTSKSKDGILTLTINRPKQLNATNDWLYQEMTKALEDAVKDDTIGVVVITGVGDKGFCAGADLEAGFDPMIGPLKSMKGSYHDPVGKFMSTVIQFQLPLVAAVNGVAVGVGLTILPHCDAVYCVPHAKFAAPFTRINACPEFCSSVLLPKIVGPTIATEMMFFGRSLTAEEAKSARLVGEILPKDGFLEHVYNKIRPVLAYPNAIRSMRLFKQLIRTPEIIAELERVHRAEMSLLDVRAIGKTSDTSIGLKVFLESQQKQKEGSGGSNNKNKL